MTPILRCVTTKAATRHATGGGQGGVEAALDATNTPTRAPTTLLDLPDELLVRIFREISANERDPGMAKLPYLDPNAKGFPRLESYRHVSRRLRRVVVAVANYFLFIAHHEEDDAHFAKGAPGLAILKLDIALQLAEHSFTSEPEPCPPYTFRLFGQLANLTDLRNSSRYPFPRSGSDALKALSSLRTLDLSILRQVDDEDFSFGRDLPSLRRLAFKVTGERYPTAHPWLSNSLRGLQELEVDGGFLEPKPHWESLQALTVAAADFALERLAFSCVHAEFFLGLGDTESSDGILRNLKHAPHVGEVEIQFEKTFRCDDGAEHVDVPSVKRLIVTEMYAPEDQRANLNGLDDFIFMFPRLEHFALTSHWLVPVDVAADLRDDSDPPTTLSIAYDAPLLAEQVIVLRDETDIREFRYRRARDADWELRWTREGGRGTQFEVERWWV
ncbi:hypothetical protein JCM3770_004169 [Rhodotorula araucariae]